VIQWHPKHWWKPALFDGLGPIGALFAISIFVMGEGWTKMHSLIIGGGNATTPSDVNGTLWFYWWTATAQKRGVDLLTPDVICAPTGQALGSNFPQHIDALMAAPLFTNMAFPAGFNLWVTLIPVLGGFSAWLAARWLGLGRSLAFMVAVLFAFNSLSMHELANGKPPSALVFTLPLFIGSWLKCITTRGRSALAWVVVAGFAAALAIQHYVLYALIAAFFAAGTLAVHSIRPSPGVRRRRMVVASVMVVLIGLSFSAPYLKRLLGDRRPMPAAMAPQISDPAVIREQGESIDVGYIFGVDTNEDLPRRAAFPVVLTVAAFLLIPVGGQRHRRWLAAAVGFYLLSLGPMAATSVRPEVEWMTIAGRGVPLPTWWLNQIFPFSIQFFHPCRVFPMVVLCMGMAVATGLQHWGRHKNGHLRLISPGLAILITVIGFFHVRAQGGMHLLTAPWDPHPFFEQLAEDESPGSIIEFPLGLGHATAPDQLVHKWKRSESHHDFIAALKDGEKPEDCYQLPIFSPLWDLSRGDSPQGPSTASISGATQAGFEYLIVWRSGFDVLRQAGIDIDREKSIRTLRKWFGTPLLADEQLVVWAIEVKT
jgi:hypothetical protein